MIIIRNSDPGPRNEAEVTAMHDAKRRFESESEVRFDEDSRILMPILNTLIQTKRKFYLVHLPNGAGWVLRRNRPTGVPYGRAIPADDPAADGGERRVPAEPAGADGVAEAPDA